MYSEADYYLPVKQHHDYEFLPDLAGKSTISNLAHSAIVTVRTYLGYTIFNPGAREIVRMKSTNSDESDDSTYTVTCDKWEQEEKAR